MILDWSATVPAWATIITIVGTAAATFAGVLLAFYLDRRTRQHDRRAAAADSLRGLFAESHRAGNQDPASLDHIDELEYPFTHRVGLIQNELEAIDPGCAQWSLVVNATLVGSHLFNEDYRKFVYTEALSDLKLWERRRLSSDQLQERRTKLARKLRPEFYPED